VKVVGKGFSKILPRVARRIGADEVLGPGLRPAAVVGGQRFAIIRALVSEQRAERLQPGLVDGH
jgi:hypothetical protein